MGGGALSPLAIRAFATAISPVGLNTPPRSPYFACAQYGLRRALLPGGNTGFCYGYFARWAQYASAFARGCALLTPGCVLAPFQGLCFGNPYGVIVDWGRFYPRRCRGLLAETPTGFIIPHRHLGLRFAYPGLCSGARSGLMFRKPLRGYCGLGALLPPALLGATRGNPYGVYNTPSPFGGCALLTPGCVLAPLRGAGGRDDWKPDTTNRGVRRVRRGGR